MRRTVHRRRAHDFDAVPTGGLVLYRGDDVRDEARVGAVGFAAHDDTPEPRAGLGKQFWLFVGVLEIH